MAINTSSTFGADVQQSLVDKVLPKIADTVRKDNPLLAIAMDNTTAFSGKQFRVPVKYQDSSQGGSFSGLDLFNTNKVETRVSMLFDPRFYYQSVVLEGTEVSMAETSDSVINFAMSKIQENAEEMAEGVGNLLHGDGTGNSNKDFLGLIAGADDGTNVTTYGGLTRTAGNYTTLQGNYDATAFTTGGTKFALSNLDSMIDSCSQGSYRPDLILCSPTAFSIISGLMPTPTLNFNPGSSSSISRREGRMDALTAYAGYEQIIYRGIPIVKDGLIAGATNSGGAPVDYLFVLNTSTWIFPTVSMAKAQAMKVLSTYSTGGYSDTEPNISNVGGFYMTDFKYSQNQYSWVSQIMLGGNLICTNPRYNGYFTGVNG